MCPHIHQWSCVPGSLTGNCALGLWCAEYIRANAITLSMLEMQILQLPRLLQHSFGEATGPHAFSQGAFDGAAGGADERERDFAPGPLQLLRLAQLPADLALHQPSQPQEVKTLSTQESPDFAT